MAHIRFYQKLKYATLDQILKLIGGELINVSENYKNVLIYSIKGINEAEKGDLTFLSNNKYSAQLYNTKASCCLVTEKFYISSDKINDLILIRVKDPYFIYTKLIKHFYSSKKKYEHIIKSSASIAKSAVIGKNAYIGHNVVIEEFVEIGENAIIESGTFIDQGVIIGARALIHSNVSISYSIIGDDVVILPGAKIGQDGFGFSTNQGVHTKIFHTGIVRIGNNVEIGSNTTIDRGSAHDTIIEDLVRIDNLVQIGHNVKIKKGTIIVAQVGISGSTEIGSYSAIGGQAGIVGHLVLGERVQVAAQSGVMQNLENDSIVGGSPAVPLKTWLKQSIFLKQTINKKHKI